MYNCVQVLSYKSFLCEYMPLSNALCYQQTSILSKVMIHLGMHEHPIVEGICKEFLEEIKVLVEGQVSHTLDAKSLQSP